MRQADLVADELKWLSHIGTSLITMNSKLYVLCDDGSIFVYDPGTKATQSMNDEIEITPEILKDG